MRTPTLWNYQRILRLTDTIDRQVDPFGCPRGREGWIRLAVAESRYQVLMGFDAFYFMGAQLGSVLAVLPFLLVAEGISWAAGLVVPSLSVGFVIGNALSPLMVKRSRRRQNAIIAGASAAIAVLTGLVAVAALHSTLVVFAFLTSSVLIGGAMGVTNNAYVEIISRILTGARRTDWC